GCVRIGVVTNCHRPVGGIGGNVTLPTVGIATQELYPRLGRGPIPREELQSIQRIREADVRTLHRVQLQAQQLLVSPRGSGSIARWVLPSLLTLVLRTPLLPRVQRRMFFGVPMPPLDPAFSFRESVAPPASARA